MINPDDMDGMKPIADVLGGLDILDLPDGYAVLEAVVLVKCLDKDGHLAWVQRWTKGLHIVEVLGATSTMRALNERDAVEMYGARVIFDLTTSDGGGC